MIEGAFLQLLSAIEGAPSAGRQQMIRDASGKHFFTCEQLERFVGALTFEDERVMCAELIGPKILDPESYSAILSSEIRRIIEKTYKRETVMIDQSFTDQVRTEKSRMIQLDEITLTEKNYLQELEMMIQVYAVPVQRMSLLPDAEHAMIFSSTSELIPLSRGVLELLQQKTLIMQLPISDSYNTAPGLFGKIGDLLKNYPLHTTNEQSALDTLEKSRTRYPKFRNFLQEIERSPQRTTLFKCLLQPVQRLCRYPVLFRELLNVTPTSHPDHLDLKRFVDRLDGIVHQVNDRKTVTESLERLSEIARNLGEIPELKLLDVQRRFVNEGSVKIFEPAGNYINGRLFLFSDLVLWAEIFKRGGETNLKYLGHIYYFNLKIVDCANAGEKQFFWELSERTPGGSDHTAEFSSNSNEEKRTWLTQLRNLFKPYQQAQAKTTTSPRMSSDTIETRRETITPRTSVPDVAPSGSSMASPPSRISPAPAAKNPVYTSIPAVSPPNNASHYVQVPTGIPRARGPTVATAPTTSVVSPPASADSTTDAGMCGRCSEQMATQRCASCKDTFCDECWMEVHAAGRYRTHTSAPVTDPKSLIYTSIPNAASSDPTRATSPTNANYSKMPARNPTVSSPSPVPTKASSDPSSAYGAMPIPNSQATYGAMPSPNSHGNTPSPPGSKISRAMAPPPRNNATGSGPAYSAIPNRNPPMSSPPPSKNAAGPSSVYQPLKIPSSPPPNPNANANPGGSHYQVMPKMSVLGPAAPSPSGNPGNVPPSSSPYAAFPTNVTGSPGMGQRRVTNAVPPNAAVTKPASDSAKAATRDAYKSYNMASKNAQPPMSNPNRSLSPPPSMPSRSDEVPNKATNPSNHALARPANQQASGQVLRAPAKTVSVMPAKASQSLPAQPLGKPKQ
eukprot:TRINITY_DN6474_c0_g1_i1.p1 TRINITY_DN6474_c0_g1~~TRINITY_DN6474_c0_g1_i1.p1  ORF type:complete len:1024 (-),score=256.74 TRINITY_DN6474_c0_g1_i1:344-3052(-)